MTALAELAGSPTLTPDKRQDAMRRWLDGEPVPERRAFLLDHRRLPPTRAGKIGPPNIAELAGSLLANFQTRDDFIHEFGFAIPCAEALIALTALDPLLEVGAGTGAWAKLLNLAGVDIVATDPCTDNYGFVHGKWAPVLRLGARAAVRRYPDRNLFCSWPSLNKVWLRDAARELRPGLALAVVREEATADQRTWNYLDRAFDRITSVSLPNWYGLHDYLEIWRKRDVQ